MKKRFLEGTQILMALILCAIPFYNTVINGVFNWHIKQPEVYEGGLELLAFSTIVICAGLFMRDKYQLILVVMMALYLSMSGVILPVLISVAYLEIILYIGHAINSLGNREENNIIKNLIAGIAIWMFFTIIVSLLGHGTINELRILTVLLFIIAICVKRSKNKYVPLCVELYNYLGRYSSSRAFIIVATLSAFFFMMLFAKTNTALDYDSLWYGLKSEYVLVGDNSIYDYLGLSSFVFYRPKLMEIFYLPISGLGDYSILISANIWLLIVNSIIIYKIVVQLLGGLRKEYVQLIVLSIISIPSISNIAVTAKTDTMGFMFVIAGLYFLLQYANSKNSEDMVLFLSSLCLCTGVMYTYLLWGGILFLIGIFYAIYDNWKTNRKIIPNIKNIKGVSWIVGISAIVGVVGVHLRTYVLTGYPTYPMGMNFWNKLGFSAKNFMSSDDSFVKLATNRDWLTRIYEVVFDTTNLEHMIMQWTSNITLFLFCGVLIYFIFKGNKEEKKYNWLLIILCLIESVIGMYYVLSMPLPDSNYFNLPICLGVITSLYMIYRNKEKISKAMVVSLMIFIGFQTVLSLVTHFSWYYGTHPFTTEVVTDNFESDSRDQMILRKNGLGKISNYLRKHGKNKNVLYTHHEYQIAGRFKCRIQTEGDLGSYYSDHKISENYEVFLEYVKHAGINGFIVHKETDGFLTHYINQLLTDYGYDYMLEDEKAIYYEINIQ